METSNAVDGQGGELLKQMALEGKGKGKRSVVKLRSLALGGMRERGFRTPDHREDQQVNQPHHPTEFKERYPIREKVHVLLKFQKFSRRLLSLHFDTVSETAQ